MRRQVLFLISLVGYCAGFSGEMGFAADLRTNIVVIMADDLGYSDLGCYGGEINTPNLDRLAVNGMRYSQMYNTSKCSTTRSALLTGRYVTRTTFNENYIAGPTFGEVARSAGYRTLWSGKNHSKILPLQRGFDRFYGFQGGACSYWNPGSEMPNGGDFPNSSVHKWMIDGKWKKDFIPDDPNFYTTDAITNSAVDWLEEFETDDQPFLLYLAYTAPHWPLHAHQRDIDKYKGRYDAGYQVIQKQRYQRMGDKGLIDPQIAPMHPQNIAHWNALTAEQRSLESARMEIHAAMVDNLDHNIGRVIESLDDQGKLNNTLILFFSDNGASSERLDQFLKTYDPSKGEQMGDVFSYECIGKQWAQVINCPLAKYKMTSHEGGVCTPMIAHWPDGITKKNAWHHHPLHVVDVMQTIVELSGASFPDRFGDRASKPLEGISIVPSFTQTPLAERKLPIGFDFSAGQGIRDGDWKLVKHGKGGWELYNMAVDRTETKDLASAMPDKVNHLANQFVLWEERCRRGVPERKKKKRK